MLLPEKLLKIQGAATSTFLSKMVYPCTFLSKTGYPCTFPRAVTYVSQQQGDLGFQHLTYEQ